MEELEASLKESQEGWKMVEEGLHEMHLDNLALSNEYVKSLEECLSIAHDSFESDMQQLEPFISLGLSLEIMFVLTKLLKNGRLFPKDYCDMC